MIFDAETLEICPQARGLFPKTDNVSGSFNGALPVHQMRRIHINPNHCVKNTTNKARLHQMLDEKGYYHPDQVPVSKLISKDQTISPFDFEEHFGDVDSWHTRPFRVASNSGSVMIHDASDLFAWINNIALMESSDRKKYVAGAVALRSKIQMPKTVILVGIPGARGKSIRMNGEINKSGIVGRRNDPFLEKTCLNILEDLDIDMGTVTLQHSDNDPEQYEVADVNTRFLPGHSEALYSYIQLLQNVQKRS